MATIINNPGSTPEDSSAGIVVGILVVLLIVVLFFIFVLPKINNTPSTPAQTSGTPAASTNVNVQLPPTSNTTGSPSGSSY